MRIDLVDLALQEFLAAQTGRPWGLGEAPPGDTPIYGILYRITGGLGQGAWEDPETRREVQYQVTCVGRFYREAAWLSSRVTDRLATRKSGGGYKASIPVAGIDIEDRWVVSLGSVIPSGNDRFSVDDNYRLRVANA